MPPCFHPASLLARLSRFLAPPVFAQDNSTISIPRPSIVTFDNLGNLISGAVQLIITLAAIITFFYLIVGGIKWITSGGDKGKVEEARNQITNALIGLAIVVAAWAIMKLIGVFFGIDPFALEIPNVSEK